MNKHNHAARRASWRVRVELLLDALERLLDRREAARIAKQNRQTAQRLDELGLL